MAQPMVGEIRMLAGSEAPPGWACCDGQILAIHEYRDLYAVLGNTYGGDGRTTFALPDLRGRTPLHSNQSTYKAGQAGGAATHAITTAELPGHTHDTLGLLKGASVATGALPVAAATTSTATATVTIELPAASAAGEAHDNLQPYLGVNFVIALHGVSPSRNQEAL